MLASFTRLKKLSYRRETAWQHCDTYTFRKIGKSARKEGHYIWLKSTQCCITLLF